MATEAQITCVNAGMGLIRQFYEFNLRKSPTFRTNVERLVSEEDLKVPHSELATHQSAAGKDLLAWALVGNSYALAIYDNGEEGCGYIHGVEGEVLSQALLKKDEEMFGPRRLSVP